MKLRRFSVEQFIRVLQEQEAGGATADVCRRHGITGATFCKWNEDSDVSRPPIPI